MSRLKNLVWLGSLVGAVAWTLLLNAWGVPYAGVLAFTFYLVSGITWSDSISIYRRQELDYFEDHAWLQFLIGLAGPFYLAWCWVTDFIKFV